MVAIAHVTTANNEEAPDSVPRRVFEVVPDVEIEVERFVPLGESAVPYYWVMGDRLDAFERTIRGYSEVNSLEQLERIDGGALYRMDWVVDSPMIHCIQESGASLLEAHGTAERWKLTVWFESGAVASDLLQCCNARNVPIEIDRIRSVTDESREEPDVVTLSQREALTTAFELGYYEEPREVTQEELASRLDISAAAVGSRLRRGTANLVEWQLVE